MLYSGRLWPYLQTLDYGRKACHGRSSLLLTLINYSRKKIRNIGPWLGRSGANVIKLFYLQLTNGLNKLECLQLASLF